MLARPAGRARGTSWIQLHEFSPHAQRSPNTPAIKIPCSRLIRQQANHPGFLALLAPVLFVTGLGVSQVVVGLAGENEMGIAIAAGVMLANVLGSAGLFLVACVWGEVQAWIERPR